MFDFVRSYLDELLTGLFLLLVAVLTVAHPPLFATHGGLLLARIVLWSAAILVCLLLAASRFSPRARSVLHFVFEFGPIVVAVVGYAGLRLLDASAITARLGIPSFDHAMMAADVAIFGKTPYLWFMRWDSTAVCLRGSCPASMPCTHSLLCWPWAGFCGEATGSSSAWCGAR